MPSRNTYVAVLMAALASIPTMSMAGVCPPDQVLTKPRVIEQIAAAGLKREVLANVRLKGWRGMGGFILRMRRLELAPGGFVPTHAHDDRPAIVYTVTGTVTEHNTYCAVPIVHHAGDVSEEFGPGYQHWWENTGTETVVFISTDVLPYNSDAPPYVGIEP
jgi:quercetin dioxygenase-like cupin family protein